MRLSTLLSKLFPPLHGTALYLALAGMVVLCTFLFFALQALPPKARKMVIAGATFLAGLFYALEWFWPAGKDGKNPLTFAVPTVGNVANVLTAFTLGLGVMSLIRIHGNNVARQKSGWENSLVLLLGMLVMAVSGLFFENSIFFRSLFRDVLNSFDAAMFATLAFYIISAAYRAFRIKSVEATLMMLAALVVMLGMIPIGQALTAFIPERGSFASLLRVDNISNWMLVTLNAAAQRAINFGLGIGALAIALRVWLSLERGAYFESSAE
jgi:hypothetical protein